MVMRFFGGSKMTEKKLKKFEKRLIAERTKLLEKLNFDKDQFFDLNKNETGDIVDQAFNMYEKDWAIQLSEGDKKILKAINGALNRMKVDSYGKCVCGKKIDEKRLEAIPWTFECVHCVHEKKPLTVS